MKFTCSIELDKPAKRVAELFADPENLKKYQEGFISKELIKRIAGEKGAVSKMLYKSGKGEMELTETIIENHFPHVFVAHYHHKHMDNFMRCRFIPLSDKQTRYESEIEYTEFRGLLPNMMAFLFPGIFKKQVEKWLENFKLFVEKEEKIDT